MKRRTQAIGLERFVIYNHQQQFIVQRFEGDLPTKDIAFADTLDQAQAHLPRGVTPYPRCYNERHDVVMVYV